MLSHPKKIIIKKYLVQIYVPDFPTDFYHRSKVQSLFPKKRLRTPLGGFYFTKQVDISSWSLQF